MPKDLMYQDDLGIELGFIWNSIESAGVYVPGGTASYPSSVIMNTVPAKIAGVEKIIMVTHINRVIIATKDRIEGRYLTSLTSMSPSLRTVEIIFNSSVSIAFKRIALYYCILFILAPHPANLFSKFSYPLSR